MRKIVARVTFRDNRFHEFELTPHQSFIPLESLVEQLESENPNMSRVSISYTGNDVKVNGGETTPHFRMIVYGDGVKRVVRKDNNTTVAVFVDCKWQHFVDNYYDFSDDTALELFGLVSQ